MQEILLISENNVRANTNISSNVQSKYLISTIREAQLDLEEILGSRLYNKIIKLVKYDLIDDERFVSYKSLLDRCQLYLSYNTLTKLIVVSNFHIDNFGVSQSKDDNLENVNLSDTFKLEAYYQNKVDEFTKRIQEYLLANHKEYKELCKAELDEIHSNLYSAASTSIWLGGARGKYYPWHFHCHHSHSGEHKGIVIDTKYILQDVNYPKTVQWNATSATINYTGITVSIYDDGFIEETEVENGTIKIEFPVNISDNPIEIEGIEFWKDQEIPYSFKQLANVYIIDTTYEIVNTNYPKQIDAETTSFTVCFTGKTINHYSDGSQDSELTTYCEDVEVEENISRKDKEIAGKFVKDNFEVTYKVVQKGIQKQPEIVDTQYDVIDTDYPTDIPYDATSITVCYTGQTTYTWDDGSKTYETVTKCVDVTVEPNDSVDDKEIKEDIEDDGYEIPIDVIQDGKPINCETTYQSNYPSELNYDVASFEICLTALTTCYFKDGHTDETIKNKCFTIDCGLNDTNEDRNIQGIIDEDGYEFEYNLIQHPNPKYIVNVEHIVFDIENPLEVESYITSITFNYKLKTIYHYLDGTTDEVVNSFTQTETFDANESYDNPKMNYYRVYDEQCWTKQKPKEDRWIDTEIIYKGDAEYSKFVSWDSIQNSIVFTLEYVKTYESGKVERYDEKQRRFVNYSINEGPERIISGTIGNTFTEQKYFDYEFTQEANPDVPPTPTECETIIYRLNGTSESYTLDEIPDSWKNQEYDITDVKIGNCVSKINLHSFENCIKLSSVTIPDSVTYIGNQAFYNCNLTSLTIPDSVTFIENDAFASNDKLKFVKLSNNLTEIRSFVFLGCTSLESIVIPNGVTKIGQEAFSGCTSLSSVTLPDTMHRISYGAFCGTNIESIDIPSSVESLVGAPFWKCANLKTAIIRNPIPFVIYESPFRDCPNLTSIYVPAESVEAYKQGYVWRIHSDIIKPLN